MKNIFRSIVLSSALMCGVVMIAPQMTVMQEAAAAQGYDAAFGGQQQTVALDAAVNAPNINNIDAKIGDGDLNFFGTITDDNAHGAIHHVAAFNATAGVPQILFNALNGRAGVDKKLSAKGIVDCVIEGLKATGEIARRHYLLGLVNDNGAVNMNDYRAAAAKQGGLTLKNFVEMLNDKLKNQNRLQNLPTGGTLNGLFSDEVAALVYRTMTAKQDNLLELVAEQNVAVPGGWDGNALKGLWCDIGANNLEFTTDGNAVVFTEADVKAVEDSVDNNGVFVKMKTQYDSAQKRSRQFKIDQKVQTVAGQMQDAYNKNMIASTEYAKSVAEGMVDNDSDQVNLDEKIVEKLKATSSLISKIKKLPEKDSEEANNAVMALEGGNLENLPVAAYNEYEKGLSSGDAAVRKAALKALENLNVDYQAPKNIGGNDQGGKLSKNEQLVKATFDDKIRRGMAVAGAQSFANKTATKYKVSLEFVKQLADEARKAGKK